MYHDNMVVLLLTGVVFFVSVLACFSDARTMRIPNSYSVVVIAAFAIAFAIGPESFGKWWWHLGSAALIFAITYVMFAYNMLGSGDSKFGTALGLWVGFKGLLSYVFFMALLGGALGILSLVFRRYKPFANPLPQSWVARAQEGANAVPYGIAISFGAWAGMAHTGFLNHQLDELIRIIHS